VVKNTCLLGYIENHVFDVQNFLKRKFFFLFFFKEITMGNKVKVQKTKNNQHIITLPKTLAELFDIKQGTILEFKVNKEGEIVLRKK
tara:strand:- start:849 stop:1109 length:261 start_codon:yes stop_codon:yes gene_type:complete